LISPVSKFSLAYNTYRALFQVNAACKLVTSFVKQIIVMMKLMKDWK